MRHARPAIITLLAAGAAAVAAPATAQSARDILNQAMERYEQRVRSIDNYTVVQETLGTDVTLYYEKQIVDGKPVFTATRVGAGDQSMSMPAGDVYGDLSNIVEHAIYDGRQDVDGHATHAIRIDEAGLVSWTETMTQNAGDGFEPKSVTMYLDAAEYVPRRMLIEGVMSSNGQTRPATAIINLADYREVDGFLHPFRTTFSIEGMVPEGMSEEDIENARQQIAEFEKQMADMPESQRAMVERMMGDRIKQMRELLESGGTTFTMETKEVRVNAGPPGSD